MLDKTFYLEAKKSSEIYLGNTFVTIMLDYGIKESVTSRRTTACLPRSCFFCVLGSQILTKRIGMSNVCITKCDLKLSSLDLSICNIN